MKDHERLLILSYEEMKEDPHQVILKIANFLNVKLSQKEAEAIKLMTSFEQMKKNPKVNYEHWDTGIKIFNHA